ncbi:choline O-acetyltransferase-like isoform X2 [Convolutriloba macropyga]|uniref:choline O-acetyltransferase-like isoform X2 n=1 Tax=Convolutriloba macropyga TaxID=536237 RepID=UPI003F528C75
MSGDSNKITANKINNSRRNDDCGNPSTTADQELDLFEREFSSQAQQWDVYKTYNQSFKYWLRDMYLRNQGSLPLMSNAAIFVDKHDFKDKNEWLRYVAKFVVLLLNVRMQIINKTLPVEYVRTLPEKSSQDNRSTSMARDQSDQSKQPLCMDQYTAAVSTYRRCGEDSDTHIRYSLNLDMEEPTHVIVAYKGEFYALKVGSSGGRPIDEQSLFESFKKITTDPISVNNSDQKASDCSKVGIGTTANRKEWAQLWKHLSESKTNRKNLNIIESSFAMICLDDCETHQMGRQDNSHTPHDSVLRQLLLGGEKNYGNRWYDKALQVISSCDGVFGISMEHSIAEGVVWLRVISIIQQMIRDEQSSDGGVGVSTSDDVWKSNEILGCPKHLKWDLDSKAVEQLNKMKSSFMRNAADVNLDYVVLADLNKLTIKRARINPDIFVQLMLQLAYYRTHGCLCHSYESASLRRFDRGRADNIRANNPTTLKFVQKVSERDFLENITEAKKLLLEACTEQQRQIDTVIRGRGADMLLQCMKDFCREKQVAEPFLLSEEFADTFNFKLTTSQMSSGKSEQFAYYGPVSPDGYGVCYNIHNDVITLCVSSLKSSKQAKHSLFLEEIQNAKEVLKKLI